MAPPLGIPTGLIADDPPRDGRAIEDAPLAGMDLGVGETIPFGIPPGDEERIPAAEAAGEGARRPLVGGFKRDVVG